MISGLFSLAILAGIGFAVWTALRGVIKPANGEQRDAAAIGRSAAIAVGLYLAMLAVTVGLIDLSQAIAGGSRIAGSDDDLARGLSLLIVGTPVSVFLLRMTAAQRAERLDAGDARAPLGWTIYLVIALATTLIGTLVSATQVLDQALIDDTFARPEFGQLIGWAVVWVAHWFGLRPRLGVRGGVHTLVGSTLGLGWLVTGVVAFSGGALTNAYERLFDQLLLADTHYAFWAAIAVVGAVTWWWHWRVLNGANLIEGVLRRTDVWFVAVVAIGIVPATIALLVLVGAAISGTLIWFLGTVNESAVDWFDPAPTMLAATLVAVAVLALYRWELARGPQRRNESLRFHDYSVAGIGLVAVVTGIAMLVQLVIDELAAGETIARAGGLDNRLIGVLTLLSIGAAMWWWIWRGIEQHRAAQPVAEADSVWRKLYLILAAGIGGLVLAVSAIWVLFVFLRDLFDGELGATTWRDLAGPIGWAVAVLGAVWYHFEVWRADRPVLAAEAEARAAAEAEAARASMPPPPAPGSRPIGDQSAVIEPATPTISAPVAVATSPATPPSTDTAAAGTATAGDPRSISMRWALPDDAGALFTLQRAAFVDEAIAYDTVHVPPLTESFERFQARTAELRTLVAHDPATRIVGAVGLRIADGHAWLERLMVAPDRRHESIGARLVDAIAAEADTSGHPRVRAVVGDRDPRLVAFYDKLGFTTIGRTAPTDTVPSLLVMERSTAERNAD